MNSFLLEVLTEELPYRFIPSAMEQLKNAYGNLLNSHNLPFSKVNVYATPRRLAVVIEDLAGSQEDVEKTLKGPVLNIAKDENGKLTPAGLGFAGKNGVEEDSLYEQDGYIWAKIKQNGKSAKEILAENSESIILKLQGPYFMRWGYLDIKFSRPIENVVALFNNEVLPLTIAAKESGRKTMGHRFSKHKEVEIKNPESYLKQLEEVNVIADSQMRRERIIELAKEKADEINAVVRFEGQDDLLEEVTYLTEWPTPVVCDFDEKYLAIPDIVTTTVMSKHQRYFPLYSKEGKLLNHFITMANFVGDLSGDSESFKNIKAGNQRVVTARLDDGIFFYKDDTKEPLESKLEDLKGITFQRDLGTMYDKTQRIVELSKYLCEKLGRDCDDTIRAARLCKADLATKLVFEFTELQGFIGADYARASGEKENVAKAVAEHYFPLNATSELAEDFEGQITGIADKIDTICAVFISTQGDKKKKRPTGSADPLGVRRAVLGVLRTIIFKKLDINLSELIEKSAKMLSSSFGIELECETIGEIEEFFTSRLIIMYEKMYRQDVLEACTQNTGKKALEDLVDYLKRVEVVSGLVEEEGFTKFSENATRVVKIAKDTRKGTVNEALLSMNEEKSLYNFVKNIETKDYKELAGDLKSLAGLVDIFFENVLVMDENPQIKENRISLLNIVKEKFAILCDFSKIVKG